MTNEEALQNIGEVEDVLIHCFGGYPYTEDEQRLFITIDMARIALKRQTPKKPVNLDLCPKCNRCIEMYLDGGFNPTRFEFCPNCGQSIDWSDKNDLSNV